MCTYSRICWYVASSSTTICENDPFNESRTIVLARFISLTNCDGTFTLRMFPNAWCHLSSSDCISCSISLSFASIAAVRMITPKFFGNTFAAIPFKRFFSSLARIFFDKNTFDENGTKTTLRPASEISAVNLGPLVEIASLAICTMIVCPVWRYVPILPSFSNGGSSFMLSRRKARLPGWNELMSFCNEAK